MTEWQRQTGAVLFSVGKSVFPAKNHMLFSWVGTFKETGLHIFLKNKDLHF